MPFPASWAREVPSGAFSEPPGYSSAPASRWLSCVWPWKEPAALTTWKFTLTWRPAKPQREVHKRFILRMSTMTGLQAEVLLPLWPDPGCTCFWPLCSALFPRQKAAGRSGMCHRVPHLYRGPGIRQRCLTQSPKVQGGRPLLVFILPFFKFCGVPLLVTHFQWPRVEETRWTTGYTGTF